MTPEDFEPTVEAVRKLIHPEDLDSYATAVRAAFARGLPFSIRHRIVRPDGAVRTLLVRGDCLAADDGARYVGTTHDITGRESETEQLWQLANHDPLTDLLNRRRLMEELEREVAMAGRTGAPGAVMILDLDNFKDVNDIVGHSAGDTLLAKVARLLAGRLRSTDTLARWPATAAAH